MTRSLTGIQTTWGSREGADADNGVRMIRLPRYGSTVPDGRKSDTFDDYDANDDDDLPLLEHDFLPAYERHARRDSTVVSSPPALTTVPPSALTTTIPLIHD